MKNKKAATSKASKASAEPTWYADIRGMFTKTDIDHMRGVGIDLSSYAGVKSHASDIYQQTATGRMPPGKPWNTKQQNTFLKWMQAGYPKGIPTTPKGLLRAVSAKQVGRVRKDITALSSSELNLLKKAFKGIMDLPSDDPNSYFVQAGYHWLPEPSTWCVHHAPGYNPWHRAYLVSFENALRSIPGCEQVTLPYWDITKPFPDVLKKAPFDSYTYPEDIGHGHKKGDKTSRFDYKTIKTNLSTYKVTEKVQRALTKTDWEDFHGMFAGATNNTIINAHDSGHVSIGPTMSDQDVAAFDPVFWFFHCNWDRLFWVWQKQMQATDLNGLLSTIDKDNDPVSYQIFTEPALEVLVPFTENTPYLTTLKIIDSVNSLDIEYKEAAPLAAPRMVRKLKRESSAAEAFAVDTKTASIRVNGINRLKIPGSFFVHLTQDGKVLESTCFFQPNEAEKCENCSKNAIVHFDFELPLQKIAKGELGVWVEPLNKEVLGDHFPHKMMGNPTVDVRLNLSTE